MKATQRKEATRHHHPCPVASKEHLKRQIHAGNVMNIRLVDMRITTHVLQ